MKSTTYRRTRRALSFLSLGAFTAFAPFQDAQAQDISYVGPDDGLWSSPTNWSPNNVPDSSSENVSHTLERNIQLDINATIGNLSVGGTDAAISAAAHNLTITGTTSITGALRFTGGGTVTSAGNFTNDGHVVIGPGSTATLNSAYIGVTAADPSDEPLFEVFGTDSGGAGNSGNGLATVNGGLTNGDYGSTHFHAFSNGAATATLRATGLDVTNNTLSFALAGQNSSFRDEKGDDALRNLSGNSGLLELARHHRTTATTTNFANTNAVVLFGGANLTVAGAMTNDGFVVVTPYDLFNDISQAFPGFGPAPAGVLASSVVVNGNLTLTANSFLAFEIHSLAIQATIDVNGVATLDGELFLGLALDDSTISNSDVFTLMQTDGAISGMLDNVGSGERLDVFPFGASEPSGSFVVNYSGNALTLSGYQVVPELSAAASRKMHMGRGPFEIDLPLTGSPGVECRGDDGNHILVFTFTNTVTSGSASVTSGTGSVAGTPSFSANTMIVNLTGVSNAQVLTVKLSGVTDPYAHVLPDMTITAAFLLGDTNANGAVNSGDATQTRNRSGESTAAANFRSDVNTDGAVNGGDAIIVKNQSGSGIAP